jgi:hypothetical protein
MYGIISSPGRERIDPGRDLELALDNMGSLVAWGQLRASGRDGSANADDLIGFTQGNGWKKRLLGAAADCANTVTSDWTTYCAAFDAGAFKKTD